MTEILKYFYSSLKFNSLLANAKLAFSPRSLSGIWESLVDVQMNLQVCAKSSEGFRAYFLSLTFPLDTVTRRGARGGCGAVCVHLQFMWYCKQQNKIIIKQISQCGNRLLIEPVIIIRLAPARVLACASGHRPIPLEEKQQQFSQLSSHTVTQCERAVTLKTWACEFIPCQNAIS